MPRHDHPSPHDDFNRRSSQRLPRHLMLALMAAMMRRRGPNGRGGREAEGEPVEPHKPRPLAGGAAARLEFDE